MNDDAGSSFEGPGYDIVGDVHGHVEQLEKLLTKLGYVRDDDGVPRHPKRTMVFVGDLIDGRHDHQLATLRLVKSMCDAGSAKVVLGNHEFNAVAYATVDPGTFDYCRPHSDKNFRQHHEFLDEIEFGSPLHDSIVDWFSSLPLWLDLGGVRVVHACWSQDDIDHLSSVLDDDGSLNKAVVRAGTTKGSRTYDAIENVLKGPEVDLAGHSYFDKSGHRRHAARVAWWDATATTLDRLAIRPHTDLFDADDRVVQDLPNSPVEAVPRYTDDVPVVVGHYWKTIDQDGLTCEHDHVVCVDYSAGRGGPLAAYRWCGEETLVDGHLATT